MQEIARIHIGASPEAVFELLADTDRRGEWQEGVETFDYASAFDPNDAVGATFTQHIREGWRVTEYKGEITTYDPPACWGSRTVGGSYAMVVEYRLTPVDGGTAVITVVEVDSSSWVVRLMGFLFGWLTRSLGRKHLRKLKELAEAADAQTVPRIRLIHWNAAEAAERAVRLAHGELRVDHTPLDPAGLKSLRADPPDAVVIDLSRLPSHGRDLGAALRQGKATRGIPLVFVGGDPAKVSRLRELLPDAVYTDWAEIHSALANVVANPPTDPVVPDSNFAGYSGTPLPRKLGIKPGYAVALVGAPADFEHTLGELPADVSLRRRAQGRCDLIVWFVGARRDLERHTARYGATAGAGGLWICWPKKASGVVSDLSERVVREAGLARGLVDYKIASIDQTWSGLRFTRRKSG